MVSPSNATTLPMMTLRWRTGSHCSQTVIIVPSGATVMADLF
jgi:hypothetical protein